VKLKVSGWRGGGWAGGAHDRIDMSCQELCHVWRGAYDRLTLDTTTHDYHRAPAHVPGTSSSSRPLSRVTSRLPKLDLVFRVTVELA